MNSIYKFKSMVRQIHRLGHQLC